MELLVRIPIRGQHKVSLVPRGVLGARGELPADTHGPCLQIYRLEREVHEMARKGLVVRAVVLPVLVGRIVTRCWQRAGRDGLGASSHTFAPRPGCSPSLRGNAVVCLERVNAPLSPQRPRPILATDSGRRGVTFSQRATPQNIVPYDCMLTPPRMEANKSLESLAQNGLLWWDTTDAHQFMRGSTNSAILTASARETIPSGAGSLKRDLVERPF